MDTDLTKDEIEAAIGVTQVIVILVSSQKELKEFGTANAGIEAEITGWTEVLKQIRLSGQSTEASPE